MSCNIGCKQGGLHHRWAISHKVRLVRDPTQTARLDGWATLGDLLKYKSCNGVKVRLLAWDETTSLNIAGVQRV